MHFFKGRAAEDWNGLDVEQEILMAETVQSMRKVHVKPCVVNRGQQYLEAQKMRRELSSGSTTESYGYLRNQITVANNI